ncbi:Copper amine oxidase N-terminal domain-containing protein [Dethiosulfatibacter aminovorans DSM 17477]|uniref:Copper amine oxidase N-terminal domain-containing protein n=1 Tax=Dethiosulfatibacter aminovorans DSM 17477 TaxID=1121476 RepID=A0A1M6AXY5_9FIRM|nr:copper amine oxidase N-terminal domain-containing protein [Dethiosulfatibacter aminovorans]SHI41354.1 Copper amine oxidase N-terminal domain-containing protein [Dethiosulfatibacter aminovorans DSM 17477]
MKRFVALILVLALLLSLTMGVAYGESKGRAAGKDKEKPVKVERVEKATGKDKKAFKQELNEAKREVQSEIAELEKMLEEMLAGETVAEGEEPAEIPEADAEVGEVTEGEVEEEPVMTVEDIENRLAELKLQKKEIINQRFMVVKSEYTPEELNAFNSATELIEEMYANALGLGSVTVRDNIIKFDTPPYIKGGRTVVPVRAITEELGAQVEWDEETQTVKITMEGSNTTIVLGINSTTVLVTSDIESEGTEAENEVIELDVAPEITNGRTYVPLRFIAETFGLDVDWDEDSETIDIDDPGEDGTEEDAVEDGDAPATTEEAITMEI